MAATRIATLSMALEATTSGMTRGLNQAKGKLNSFQKFASRVGPSIANALSFAGAAISIGAFVGQIKKAFTDLDKLAKTANKLGVEASDLQLFRFAAEQTGVSIQTADMALQRFIRRTAEAAKGTGEAKGALKELNLDASLLSRLPLDDRMKMVADAFKAVESPADRLRLAFKLFDSEGAALVNTLSEGGDALERLFKQREKLGGLFNDAQLKKIQDANDAMNRMSKAIESVAGDAAIEVAPAAEGIANALPATQEFSREFTRGLLGGKVKGGSGIDPKGGSPLDVLSGKETLEQQLQRTLFQRGADGRVSARQRSGGALDFLFRSLTLPPADRRRRSSLFTPPPLTRGPAPAIPPPLGFESFNRGIAGFGRQGAGIASLFDGAADPVKKALAAGSDLISSSFRATAEVAGERIGAVLRSSGEDVVTSQQAALQRGSAAAFSQGRANQRAIEEARAAARAEKEREKHTDLLTDIRDKIERDPFVEVSF